MPRIRTIKPEFWDSPDTARATAVARLAYIGMWNWADDHGRGTANLKELEGFIFPNDDVEELSGGKCRKFRDVVAEVAECFGVVFYTVRGRPFYAIPAWEKHQRNERKAGSKYPGPDEADSPVLQGREAESRNFRDSAAEAPKSSGPGTGEEGNRGRGEQSIGCPSDSTSGTEVVKADAADKSAAPKRKQGHRLPDGWMPDQQVVEQMQGERPDLDFDLEHRKFTDYWIAQPGAKGRKVDWNATWRNWIRNARVDKSRQEYKPGWQKRLEHAAIENQQYKAPSDDGIFSIGR